MMLHYPEVMKKAQADIDQVVGSDQLPSLNDRPDLPYIDCILKEVWRFVFCFILQLVRFLDVLVQHLQNQPGASTMYSKTLDAIRHLYPYKFLGLLHASVEEDEYKGKIIPAGSLVIPNIWSVRPLDPYDY